MAATKNVLQNTQGTHVRWGVETTTGTRPTLLSAYTELEQITTTPDMNTTPNTITSTPLSETVQEHTAAGLKSAFDTLEYPFNYSDESAIAWATMVTAYGANTATGKALWIVEDKDQSTMADYYTGQPLPLGKQGRDGDSADIATGYIIPTSSPIRAAKPAVT
jgi:hypothetical protein